MPIEASVVIPTYNRAGVLGHCLDAFARQSYPSDLYELVVADDCSTDHTAEVVDDFVKRTGIRTKYVRNKTRMNITRTRNRGIEETSGRIIIQTDSDFIPTPQFIEAHMEVHRETGVMCTGPVINIVSMDELFHKRPSAADICRHPLPGANGSVSKEALQKAGGYDEDLCEYGWEDLELATRLKTQGIRSRRSARAAGYHIREPFSMSDLPAVRSREEARARMAVVFASKWPTVAVRMATWVSPVFFALDRIIFAFDWIHSPAVESLMERWLESGKSGRAEILARLYANHWYVQALRNELCPAPASATGRERR